MAQNNTNKPPTAPPQPSKPSDLEINEARANLLESIRNTGGFANAGLKPVGERKLKDENFQKGQCCQMWR